MKQWQLRHEGQAFYPQKYKGILNESCQFSKSQLQAIKEEAFGERGKRYLGGEYMLDKIFRAGMCTGLSAWVLLNYVGKRPAGEEKWGAAVLQARVLSPGFWRRCLADYNVSPSLAVESLKKGWDSGEYHEYGLLFIVPRLGNLAQINNAHALLPYKIMMKSNHVQIAVYDCNDPFATASIINLDLLSGDWQYHGFNSTRWYLSSQKIQYLL